MIDAMVHLRTALFVLEFESIAVGLEAADAVAKKAELLRWQVGTVQPGRFLILGHGSVAECEEAWAAGRATGASALIDQVFLPDAHRSLVEALERPLPREPGEALGVLETRGAAAAAELADALVKASSVSLRELRFGDGLGGRGLALFQGALADVEVAIALARSLAGPSRLLHSAVLSQLAAELDRSLSGGSRLSAHLTGAVG